MTPKDHNLSAEIRRPLVSLLLSMADDKFFLGHRNSDWTGLAPFLEEDIAFSNIAQDEIAHAQELYKLVAVLTAPREDPVARANQLAYRRPPEERLNARLVELADEFDWSVAILRQFFYDHFDLVRLPRLKQSRHTPLAELAGKMLQEVSFHVEHFDNWVEKLGRGSVESGKRMQAALDRLWPEALGLFEAVEDQQLLVDAGLFPGNDDSMQAHWQKTVQDVLHSAGLGVGSEPVVLNPGGRRGRQSPELSALLDELAEVFSCEPDATW